MTNYVVDGVKADELSLVWEQCWPFLKRAIDRNPNTEGKHTEGDILCRLMNKTMQLWIGWNTEEHRVTGALATYISSDGERCHIELAGGDNWHSWGDEVWNLIKAWATAQKCKLVVIYGRKGWKRLYGFDEIGTTRTGIPIMVRRLKGKHNG